MKDKSLKVAGIEISYVEVKGEAPYTIYFLHGNSSNRRTWSNQLESEVLSKFRLIAFDLPAHGSSGNANDYSLPALGKLMAEAISQINSELPYILVGASIGTNIIAEMLAYDVKPVGLVLASPCIFGDACPIESIAIPNTNIGISFIDEPGKDLVADWPRMILAKPSDELTNVLISDYLAVKDNFRSKLGQSIAAKTYSDHVKLIKTRKIPTLFVFGKEDAVIYPNYLDTIPFPSLDYKIIRIEGAGHGSHLDKPNEFNELLATWCEEKFK